MVINIHIMVLFSIYVTAVLSTEADVQEYCLKNNNNVFNATCPPGHVIVMQVARYGRMREGVCVTSERDVNCYTDEITYMHALCSGRAKCQLTIPDAALQSRYPCDQELHAYLEAAYRCQRAILPSESGCLHTGPLEIRQYPGYIGSLVTESPDTPNHRSCIFQLTAKKGQQIRLTLYDFSPASSYVPDGSCVVYATVRDSMTGAEQVICAGMPGERHVLTSTGNSVTVELAVPHRQQDQGHFLLKYELTGCADPRVPIGAALTRDGTSATITCNMTSQTQKWHLICKNNAWIGRVENCTRHADRQDMSSDDTKSNAQWSVGLLVAILIGIVIGVCMGLVCLCTVTCVYKRGRCSRRYERTLPRAGQEHVHMLNPPRDQSYECAHTLQRQLTYTDTTCPYHSLRYHQQQTVYEKPSIIKDCETCVDGHTDTVDTAGTPDGCPGHHGLISSYPDQTLHRKRYLQLETVPYNLHTPHSNAVAYNVHTPHSNTVAVK